MVTVRGKRPNDITINFEKENGGRALVTWFAVINSKSWTETDENSQNYRCMVAHTQQA